MLATARTFTLDGIVARPVRVEVDVHRGLPGFAIVGLPDTAVREARERVRAALVNCGFEFPLRRIVVNLAPASLRKAGPGMDLAIAAALLSASGQLEWERLSRVALAGELALDGTTRPVNGALAIAEAAQRRRRRGDPPARGERARGGPGERDRGGRARQHRAPAGAGRRRVGAAAADRAFAGAGGGDRWPRPGRSARAAAPAPCARGGSGRRPQPADDRSTRRRQVARRQPPALDHAAAGRRRGARGGADRQRLRSPRRRPRRRPALPLSTPHDQPRRPGRRRRPAAARRDHPRPPRRPLPRRALRVPPRRPGGVAGAAGVG